VAVGRVLDDPKRFLFLSGGQRNSYDSPFSCTCADEVLQAQSLKLQPFHLLKQ
jgi:hypothetical protein